MSVPKVADRACPNCDKLNARIKNLEQTLFDAENPPSCLKCKYFDDRVKKLNQMILDVRAPGNCVNCPKLEEEVEELGAHLSELYKKYDLVKASTSKKPTDSCDASSSSVTACTFCTILENDLVAMHEAFRVRFGKGVANPVSVDCVSCEGLKLEIQAYKDRYGRAVRVSSLKECLSCDSYAKEVAYLKTTLEKLSSGEKRLNMILDKSKVSKGLGLGFDFVEDSRNNPPEPIGIRSDGAILVREDERATVFQSGGLLPMSPNDNGTSPSTGSRAEKERIVYQCTYCHKSRHLAEFCFKKLRDERRSRVHALRGMQRQARALHVSNTHCQSEYLHGSGRRDYFKSNETASRARFTRGRGQQNCRYQDGLALHANNTCISAPAKGVTQYWIKKCLLTNPSTESLCCRSFV